MRMMLRSCVYLIFALASIASVLARSYTSNEADQRGQQQQTVGHDTGAAAAGKPNVITLWHRVTSYGLTEDEAPAWWKRGIVGVGVASSSESPLTVEIQEFSQAWNSLSDVGDLYQLGIAAQEPYGNVPPRMGSFVSIPECQLRTLSSSPLQDTITLHFHSLQDSTVASKKPFHLAYSIPSAPSKCLPGDRATKFNTTVRIQVSEQVQGPVLPKPIVIEYQPDGTVKQPEPEKNFLQKYWMYLLPVFLLLLTSGGGGEGR